MNSPWSNLGAFYITRINVSGESPNFEGCWHAISPCWHHSFSVFRESSPNVDMTSGASGGFNTRKTWPRLSRFWTAINGTKIHTPWCWLVSTCVDPSPKNDSIHKYIYIWICDLKLPNWNLLRIFPYRCLIFPSLFPCLLVESTNQMSVVRSAFCLPAFRSFHPSQWPAVVYTP